MIKSNKLLSKINLNHNQFHRLKNLHLKENQIVNQKLKQNLLKNKKL